MASNFAARSAESPESFSFLPPKRTRRPAISEINRIGTPSAQPTAAAGKSSWKIQIVVRPMSDPNARISQPTTFATEPPIFDGWPARFTDLAEKGGRGAPHAVQYARVP